MRRRRAVCFKRLRHESAGAVALVHGRSPVSYWARCRRPCFSSPAFPLFGQALALCVSLTPAMAGFAAAVWPLRAWFSAASAAPPPCSERSLIIFVELRVRSQRVECLNNLRQTGGAVLNYESTNNAFPPGTVPNTALPPDKRLSWLTTLPPFMDQKTKNALAAQSLYEQLDLSLAWDDGGNAAVAHAAAPFAVVPRDPFDDPRLAKGNTSYVGFAGVGRDAAELPRGNPFAGIFGYDRVVRRDDLTAGATQTLLATETARDNGPWTAGGSPTLRGLDRGTRRTSGRTAPLVACTLTASTSCADSGADFMTDDTAPGFFETLTRVWRDGDTR